MANKRKSRKNKSIMPQCDHMQEEHLVPLTAIEALSLVTAATHAVRSGYDDAPEWLEVAVNRVLEHCRIDCSFDDDGAMVLTYHAMEEA